MKPIEAARVFFRNGERTESRKLLEHLWNAPDRPAADEFDLFCAMLEVWAFERPSSVMAFLDSVISGESELQEFWERRTMAEQSTMLEWHGQFAFVMGDHPTAFSSLTRSASLGRDTSVIWRLLGAIHLDTGDLEIGMRYLRRSLQLHGQLELDLSSGRDNPMGAFTGVHPLGLTHNPEDFLKLLLDVTKLAKGQKSLRSVRELVMDMIQHYPGDERLSRIRLMLEKAIVQSSMLPMQKRAEAVAAQTARAAPAPLPAHQAAGLPAYARGAQPAVSQPRGLSALFRL